MESRNPSTHAECSLLTVRRMHWHECSTASQGDVEIRRFRVTYPYHPLFRQEFEHPYRDRGWKRRAQPRNAYSASASPTRRDGRLSTKPVSGMLARRAQPKSNLRGQNSQYPRGRCRRSAPRPTPRSTETQRLTRFSQRQSYYGFRGNSS